MWIRLNGGKNIKIISSTKYPGTAFSISKRWWFMTMLVPQSLHSGWVNWNAWNLLRLESWHLPLRMAWNSIFRSCHPWRRSKSVVVPLLLSPLWWSRVDYYCDWLIDCRFAWIEWISHWNMQLCTFKITWNVFFVETYQALFPILFLPVRDLLVELAISNESSIWF